MSMCSRIKESIHVIHRITEADVRGLILARPKH